MEMKLVIPPMFAHNQQHNAEVAKNVPLKGIKLQETESLEHLRFNYSLKNIFSKDMYKSDCETAAKIESVPKIHVSTGGPG